MNTKDEINKLITHMQERRYEIMQNHSSVADALDKVCSVMDYIEKKLQEIQNHLSVH